MKEKKHYIQVIPEKGDDIIFLNDIIIVNIIGGPKSQINKKLYLKEVEQTERITKLEKIIGAYKELEIWYDELYSANSIALIMHGKVRLDDIKPRDNLKQRITELNNNLK